MKAQKGVLKSVDNLDPVFGDTPRYLLLKVEHEGLPEQEEYLLLTDAELERMRLRAERCPKTIAANQTGWLADLID